MSALREETLWEHREAEEAIGITRLFESPRAYCSLLERLGGFYAAIESNQRLREAWISIGLQPELRDKSHLIAADLRSLNGSSFTMERPILPDLRTEARSLGCLYVLEGATLGGQVIARLVRERHGFDFPCAFFSGYGPRNGAMWREFGAALRQYAILKTSNDEIVLGAKDTFLRLTQWLTPMGTN